jgi:TM2 domain-containing membrane protein YozV
MLKNEVRDMLDPFVVKKLKEAGEDAEQAFEMRFMERKKSTLVAFILSLFCLHRFYYGQIGLGILFIVVMLMGGIGIFWLIYDWFTMSKRIKTHNDNTALDILRQVT